MDRGIAPETGLMLQFVRLEPASCLTGGPPGGSRAPGSALNRMDPQAALLLDSSGVAEQWDPHRPGVAEPQKCTQQSPRGALPAVLADSLGPGPFPALGALPLPPPWGRCGGTLPLGDA